MSFQFINGEHKEAMDNAFEKAGVMNTTNVSIQAPLFVLTSISVFQDMDNLGKVFSFAGKYFDPDAVEQFRLSTGEMILFGLAINLYNGYVMEGVPLSPHQAMGWLSKEHRDVYLSAVEYRYRSAV